MPIALACLMSACGGTDIGEEGGSSRQIVSGPVPSFPDSTAWSISSEPTSTSCDFDTSFYTLTIDYDNEANALVVKITGDEGEATDILVTATTNNSITLSGQIIEDEGTTTFTDLELNFASNNFVANTSSLLGTSTWEWQDGEEDCSGSSVISGTLTQIVDDSDNGNIGDDIANQHGGNVGSMDYTIGDTSGSTVVNFASVYSLGIYSLRTYDAPIDTITSEGVGINTAITLTITPYSGSGAYTDTEENAEYTVAFSYVRSAFDIENFEPSITSICLGVVGSDNTDEIPASLAAAVEELEPTSLTVEIVETADGHEGTITGTVNCFSDDYLFESLGVEEVSVSYTSTSKLN